MNRIYSLSSIIWMILIPAFLCAQQTGTVEIGNINTTDFPQVSFELQFPGQDFIKQMLSPDSTFVLEDGYECEHTISCPYGNYNIAIVLDVSYSMAFKPNERPDPTQGTHTWPWDPDSVRCRTTKAAIHDIASTILPGDSLCLYSFGEHVSREQDFTNDGELIRSAVEDLKIVSGTSLWEACDSALNALASRSGERILIVLSDGDDNTSPWMVDERDVMLKAIEQQVAIYTFGLFELESAPDFEFLSTSTGGMFSLAIDTNSISDIYSVLISRPCIVEYTSPSTCRDGTERQLLFMAGAHNQRHVDIEHYKAPERNPLINARISIDSAVTEGNTIWLGIKLENLPEYSEGISIHLEISYDDDLLEYAMFPSSGGIFGDSPPVITLNSGILTLDGIIGSPGSTGDDPTIYLLFKVKDVDTNTVAHFTWQVLSMFDGCPIRTSTTGASLLVKEQSTGIDIPAPSTTLLDIYPNPLFSGQLHGVFKSSGRDLFSPQAQVRIRTADGKVLKVLSSNRHAGEYQVSWNVDELPTGLYWLEFKSGNDVQIKALTVVR